MRFVLKSGKPRGLWNLEHIMMVSDWLNLECGSLREIEANNDLIVQLKDFRPWTTNQLTQLLVD